MTPDGIILSAPRPVYHVSLASGFQGVSDGFEALPKYLHWTVAPGACPISKSASFLLECKKEEQEAEEGHVLDDLPDSFLGNSFRSILQFPVVPFWKHTSQ